MASIYLMNLFIIHSTLIILLQLTYVNIIYRNHVMLDAIFLPFMLGILNSLKGILVVMPCPGYAERILSMKQAMYPISFWMWLLYCM